MPFKSDILLPCNPASARGVSTKLASHENKIIYTNGRTVIIRDITDPRKSVAYSEHVANATVARFSPTGFYCASGDQNGNVRIWDTQGGEQKLKLEIKAFAGKIVDVAWDGESKRIIAVGDGREKYGHAFTFDTGNTAGEISGHSKGINAVSIRHQRPFRAVTASDDTTVVFYHGVPFKYQTMIKTHTRFVQDVKFSPSGDLFASAGSDGHVFLYNGTDGETLAELKDSHKGTINALSWSPDSMHYITSSADNTVKLWDVGTKKCITTWILPGGVDGQQVGNTWAGDEGIVSLSVGGDLNVFDRRDGQGPRTILYGAQKSISSTTTSSKDEKTLFAGTYDGRVISFSVEAGDIKPVKGDPHVGQIVKLASAGGNVYSAGFDDRVREIDAERSEASFTPRNFPLKGQPRGLSASSSGQVVAVTNTSITVFDETGKSTVTSPSYTPSSVASTTNGLIAVGAEDSKVYLYHLGSGELTEDGALSGNKGQISALSFSPDGTKLLAGDTLGKLVLFDVAKKAILNSRWQSHSGRLYDIAWNPDSQHVATGGLDTHVFVWNVAKATNVVALRNVGPGGVFAVDWIGSSNLTVAGADGCVRVFNVTF